VGGLNCPKQQDDDQRNTQQTQKYRQIVARGAENLFQGHFRNGHACQQHSHGANHIADTAQCAGDRGRQRDVQQVQQSTGCNGNQVDIGKELAPFQPGRALQAGTGMGPEQHQLYNDKGAGVDNIFLPQQGLHDGNDQRGGIAVNDIDLLHGVQLESFAEQRIQKQKYNVHSNGDAHGIKQPGTNLRCILDLKGVQNDTGHDQIDKDHRQHLTVRCLQQAGFYNGISHQQNQK